LIAAPRLGGSETDTVGPELAHHGDLDVVAGTVDLAVNVRPDGPPGWLRRHLAAVDLAHYPNQSQALEAVAERHTRDRREVLLTAGAAEAFVLIARALTPRRAVVVHPQFSEPEVALRAAGHAVQRVVLQWPFTFDADLVPPDADMVVIGNPTNPTSVRHPRSSLRALVRPGRTLVVDEAFADCTPAEPDSLAAEADMAGVVVVRSLTKTWGLAGLRVGYVLAEESMINRLRMAQPAWPVSSPALAACIACSDPAAVRESADRAEGLAVARGKLIAGLASIDGVRVVPAATASFVLVRTAAPDVRQRLLALGFAVRRGDTFPGLGPGWFRAAVRDDGSGPDFVAAVRAAVAR
jgi:histidinol-phosphate aminotransferase